MKNTSYVLIVYFLFCYTTTWAQHFSKMDVEVNNEKKELLVKQVVTFYNQSTDTLQSIVLNDWNNAYSSKNSLLAQRFSDEFTRTFHLATEQERGNTQISSVFDIDNVEIKWTRFQNATDLILLQLNKVLLPNQKITFEINYLVKVPNLEFTSYGYSETGDMNLKDWFLTPARYENHRFVTYENANIDDCTNGNSDFEIHIKVAENTVVVSDLNEKALDKKAPYWTYSLSGTNRNSFSLFIQSKSDFLSYKNDDVTLLLNLNENRLSDIQKALIIDKITRFVTEKIGKYPFEKITVSQADYDRNPVYGLNQLPWFLSPFTDDFTFEVKFLKTYLNNYLKNGLRLDPRKDNWIFDGIQMFYMMQYMDEYYPQSKMMGSVAKLKILKSFKVINLDFNEQYSYFYMLMARKNLDQPIGNPKTSLIKFNEKIAGKYRAGLSFKYLNSYLEADIVPKSIQEFWKLNNNQQTTSIDFEHLIKNNTTKKVNWFFETIVNSRNLIDYKFSTSSKTADSVVITIKNKTHANVPIPIYGLKGSTIVFKKWLDDIKNDSTFTFNRNNIDKLVLNYQNEVPEYNLRNNWKSLKGRWFSNRPYKFVFLKDIEDPNYNQIIYFPDVGYNLYDGVTLGMRLHNRTLLDKPFNFDVSPMFSTITKSLTGSFALSLNQNYRESRLYNSRFGISGLVSHYAPDASYYRFTPFAYFSIRENDFRNNKRQSISVRQVIVGREQSIYYTTNDTQNYSVFDLRYGNNDTEITKSFRYGSNLQLASKFGKLSGTIEYRRLFDSNRQLNLRFFGGYFLYRNTASDFFSFALDRPTDYLFDYNYIGRSETTGLFSRQLIIAEGGFKTRMTSAYANQWITAVNGSFNVWNWVEFYGDIAFYKNKSSTSQFVYDSGVRLNLVTDYFELYFPFYSSNGWDIADPNYSQKVRFIVTISPNTLISLFTRKWF